MGIQWFDAIATKFLQLRPVASPPANGVYMDENGNVGINSGGSAVGFFAAPGGASVISPRAIHTGNTPVKASGDGTDSTPVVTETYIVEVMVPVSVRITGVALFNGSVAAGSIVVALYNAAGARVANSLLAGTAMAGTDAFQRIAFTAAYQAAPGTYYVGVQYNDTSARFNTHPIGNFGASKKTSEVFGTITTITPPTTFTAGQGPMGGLY